MRYIAAVLAMWLATGCDKLFGVDALNGPDAPGPGFCSQSMPYLFCDDFDEGMPVDQGWSLTVSPSSGPTAGSVSLTPSFAMGSPPNAMTATISDPDKGESYVANTFALAKPIELAFDILVDTSAPMPGGSPSAYCEIAAFDFANTNQLDLVLDPALGLFEREYAPPQDSMNCASNSALPVGTPRHVQVDIDPTTVPPTATSTVNHVAGTPCAVGFGATLGSSVQISLGLAYCQGAGWSVHVDNVVVKELP